MRLVIQPAERLAGHVTYEDGEVGAIDRQVGGDGGDAVGEARAVSPDEDLPRQLKDTSVSFNSFCGARNRRHLEASESIEAVPGGFAARGH